MSLAARLQNRMELFHQRCAECGLANTHQRQVLYRALAETDEHPTPESLYEKVRRQIPAISLGTVYRNIKLFEQIGLLREVTPLHEPSRLDANLSDHHHVVCRRCRSIIDVPGEDIEPIRFRKALPKGFQIERYEVEILGLCAKCGREAQAASPLKRRRQSKKEKTDGKSRQTNGGAGRP
jgi:Fur family peroxide stress response transcriptional regulator